MSKFEICTTGEGFWHRPPDFRRADDYDQAIITERTNSGVVELLRCRPQDARRIAYALNLADTHVG